MIHRTSVISIYVSLSSASYDHGVYVKHKLVLLYNTVRKNHNTGVSYDLECIKVIKSQVIYIYRMAMVLFFDLISKPLAMPR